MIIFLKPCQQIQAADMILNDNLPPFFLICALLIDPIMVSYRCDQIWKKNLPFCWQYICHGEMKHCKEADFF